MKCVNHPEIEAEALCVNCHAPVCGECRVTLEDRDYCQSCLVENVEFFNKGFNKNVNMFWALLLSLIPGAGYMYLGLMNRGLQTMIIFFGIFFIQATIHLDIIYFMVPVIFYSIFDTRQLARKMCEGNVVEDIPLVDIGKYHNWQNMLGYILIGIGVLALVENFVPSFIPWTIRQMASPVIIIALGVFILYKNLKGGRDNDNQGDI